LRAMEEVWTGEGAMFDVGYFPPTAPPPVE
jgi:hypothetical protein